LYSCVQSARESYCNRNRVSALFSFCKNENQREEMLLAHFVAIWQQDGKLAEFQMSQLS
jgi:hypothetical protein